jgi:outer membrane protein W
MRRATVPFVLCILMMVSLPAAAQKTEWRFALRLTALDMNAETEPIFDTGTSMVSDDIKPTLNFEGQYMVADAWAVAFSIAPAPFKFVGEGGDLDGEALAKMWFAPATLTLRYEIQFMGDLQPYVGAGVNIGFLFAGEAESALEEYGVKYLSSNAPIGFAAEIGLNYALNPKTFATFDVKYMDLSTEIDLENNNKDNLDRVRIEGSPWQIGLGIGWRY